ncbi:MAG: outer membrane protein assembly factor BamD [Pseudomonadales bacterium]|jgi:outer membrane protein assembly factor BamD|nr:outer membrane protein assembly factor BamD [Pseudomonadales bacterium]MDP6471587.1 outer membrane protein assembly factor BamD [Pseudomonadales bacterium]MDP6828850.1 outer membrane protein assembly factor BamD [Pseudomonadales bacterium]MDP6971708.1 outer membrane protein assembly factor BamD [Pseudomonadales bacterium]|tara:strand:+ start:1108 stop:2154 length:1047 start_codon:yes stop_codon:yes gene_type:complete
MSFTRISSITRIISSIVPIAVILTSTLYATGCSIIPFFGDDDEEDILSTNTSEQLLYRNAQRYLRSGNYDQAISQLEVLEAQFPFGRYAEQAQLELIYARYQSYDIDAARTAADRFIRLHPQHKNVDYAYYLKGLGAFDRNRSMIDRVFTTDMSQRDTTSARESYADFAQLLTRFPTSQYAPDATQRMVYLRNLMASAEIHVADYYMRRGANIAAANRAQYVLENFPGAQATPDALLVLIEANYKLGLTDAANDHMRILSINYPEHPAFNADGSIVLTERIRNRDRSWTNLVTLGLLDRPEVPPPLKIEHPEGFVPPERGTQEQSDDAKKDSDKKDRKGWFSWLPFVS